MSVPTATARAELFRLASLTAAFLPTPCHSIRAGCARNSNGQRSPSPCEEPAAASLPASRRVRAAHSASSFETRARLRARDSKDCVPSPPLPRGHGARGQACRDCVECPARGVCVPDAVQHDAPHALLQTCSDGIGASWCSADPGPSQSSAFCFGRAGFKHAPTRRRRSVRSRICNASWPQPTRG